MHLVSNADPKVDFKLQSGADAEGRTCFFAPALVQTLCSAGASVNATAHDGTTPLHEAAALGASSTVLALLGNGADTTAMDACGRTPLDVAGTLCARGSIAPDTLERLRTSLNIATTLSKQDSISEPSPWSTSSSVHTGESSAAWSAALGALQARLQAQRASVKRGRSTQSATTTRRKSGRTKSCEP